MCSGPNPIPMPLLAAEPDFLLLEILLPCRFVFFPRMGTFDGTPDRPSKNEARAVCAGRDFIAVIVTVAFESSSASSTLAKDDTGEASGASSRAGAGAGFSSESGVAREHINLAGIVAEPGIVALVSLLSASFTLSS